jgi:hypothetical protein
MGFPFSPMIASPSMGLNYNRWPQFYNVSGMTNFWVVDQSGRVYSYNPDTLVVGPYLWAIDGTNTINYVMGHVIFGNSSYIYQFVIGGGYSGESHLRKFRTSDGVTVLNDPSPVGSVTSWHRMNHKQVVQTGDGKVYIINFTNADSYNRWPKRVIVYTPASDVSDGSTPLISNSNDMPAEYKSGEGSTGGAIAVGLIGKIFIFGGVLSKRVCILNPIDFSYNFGLYDDFTCPLVDAHAVRYGPVKAAPYILDGCVYFYGGWYNDTNNDNHYPLTIMKFDPLAASGSQWTTLSVVGNTEQMGAFSYNGQSYLAGGYYNATETQYIYRLISASDCFIMSNYVSSLTTPRLCKFRLPSGQKSVTTWSKKQGTWSLHTQDQDKLGLNFNTKRMVNFSLPESRSSFAYTNAKINQMITYEANNILGFKPSTITQVSRIARWGLKGATPVVRRYPAVNKVSVGVAYGDNLELVGTASADSPTLVSTII